jgi:hypothetical protein
MKKTRTKGILLPMLVTLAISTILAVILIQQFVH